MRRRFLLLVCTATLALSLGCNRGRTPSVVEGPKSPPGWEVRYNAAAALARRGSDKALEPRVKETLLEMLDEQQQMRNFRKAAPNGKEASDAGGAQLTVITTLHALNELHRRRPELDLGAFADSVQTLADHSNLAVSTEAKKTQQLLARP